MSLFFAPSTGGFYKAEIHGDAIPPDAVEITAEQHASLLAGQTNGSIIVADQAGLPTLASPPPPSPDQLMMWMRGERDQLLRDSDFTQLPDTPIDPALREEWRLYRQALRDLPEAITDPAAINWPIPPAS
ncbi:tail fiber assembly protein [Sphingobium sp. MI1205]|uniref:tail fiber assembly protein n=1 Tax=Sphingobium sp. MI1205 TaxID=407020 RepID=UPI00076FF6B5|nr:tail fiber assembly protein [Sphingobium sp. MI1205]AMK16701.1 putative phage tail fiber protein [Sphingobium sp. MI1205]